MCGIVGGVWSNHLAPSKAQLKKSLDLLSHRGPDHQSFNSYQCGMRSVSLGHARLSIIDLSSAGFQPFVSKDGRYSLVFNGEIYNYIELRNELRNKGHSFFTNTDTEVLINAWIQWQDECLSKLRGMFAFVIYDNLNSKIYAATDAFGIKPMFYKHLSGNSFIFSSEVPSLLSLDNKKPTLNLLSAYQYLHNGLYDFSSDTFLISLIQ